MRIGLVSLFKYALHYALIILLLTVFYFYLNLSFFWIALTTLLFSLAESCRSPLSFKYFSIIVAITVSTITIASLLSQSYFLWICFYLAFLSGAILWFEEYGNPYPEIFLTILLFNIIVATNENSVSINFLILGSIFLGLMIIFVVKIILFPINYYHKKIDLLSEALHALINLNDDIFACLLQSDYGTNVYLYERRIHYRKAQYLHVLKKINREFKDATKDDVVAKIKSTYSDLLDISQIRRRVKDYTTFALCQPEFKKISHEIKRLLQTVNIYFVTNKIQIDLKPFARAVQQLDDNYHHVLQIAAKEPIVFALFIQSLNRLPQNWISFFHDVSEINESKRNGQ